MISPIGVSKLREFEYNPDLINQFSMSRIIGLGLSLMRDDDANNKESTATNNFIIKKFSYLESNIDFDVEKKSNKNR